LNRRQVKKEIFKLLNQYEPAELSLKLTAYPRIQVINTLFMALCDMNERVRWHAVSCFGELVACMVEEDAESGRVIMRRFLWSLNDESGGIGWGAPESMAQIMCRSALLRHEYIHMLISYMQEDGVELYQDGNYLELPLLQRGLLWGVGTLCYSFPVEMIERGLEHDILRYLDSEDVEVRRLTLWALAGLGASYSKEFIDGLDEVDGQTTIYMDGSFKEMKIHTICSQLVS
jgi:hypothetical protein